jgi:hypothetical protein
MSLTKRWIEEEMMKGNDVLHPDYQSNYDEYEYEQWSYNQQKKKKIRNLNIKNKTYGRIFIK